MLYQSRRTYRMSRPKPYSLRLALCLTVCTMLQQISTASFLYQIADTAIAAAPSVAHEGIGDIAWQRTGPKEPTDVFQEIPQRRLQQISPTVNEAWTTREIATQPGYDGVLSDEQLSYLYQQYLDLHNITLNMLPHRCLSKEEVDKDFVFPLSGTASNFVVRDCDDTVFEIHNETMLENVIFYNNNNNKNMSAMIKVLPGASLSLVNVTFLGNTGFLASGVYGYEGSQVSATGLVMHGNAQRLVGGGRPGSGMVLIRSCLTSLDYSTFVGNGVPADGGKLMPLQGSAVYLTGQIGNDTSLNLVGSSICDTTINENVFKSNVASEDGGALYLDSLKTVQLLYHNVFENNKAVNGFGGAVHVGSTFFASISFNHIATNHARQGGAVNVQASRIIMTGNNFMNNSADVGGAVQVFGNEASMGGNSYIGNTATYLGGAINAAKLSVVYIQDSQFDSNTAGSGGAAAIDAYNRVWIENTHFTSNRVVLNSPDATQCSAEHLGGGGALCINTVPSGRSDIYGVSVVNCTFTSNLATNGGAVLFPALCKSDGVSAGICAEMAFNGNMTTFSDNSAVGGSGDIVWMAASNNSLKSACDNTYDYTTAGRLCPQWTSGSSSPSSVMHQPLASSAGQLVIGTGNNSLNFIPNSTLPNSLVSSAVTPMQLNVKVLVQDDYGKPVTTGSGDANATITAKVKDPNVKFIGSPIVAAKEGVATFNNLGIKAPAGNYTLTFKCNDIGIIVVQDMKITVAPMLRNNAATQSASGRDLASNITVTVRGCRVGEVQAAIDECTACRDANQYSFNPANVSCDTCPPDAYCGYDGKNTELPPYGPIGAVLVPVPGYWHSSPRSQQVHQCPYPSACTGDVIEGVAERTTLVKLQKDLVLNGTDLQSIDVGKYNSLQCREGQYGNVCAGCLQGFGRRTEGECVRCPQRALNSFILFLAVLIRIFMVGLTISSQLQAFKDEYNDPEPSTQPSLPMKLTGRLESMNPSLLINSGNVSHMQSHKATRSDTMKTLTVEQRVERCFGSDTTAFKILINYLQITAILKGVTLELPAPVLRLLSAAGVVSNGVQSWISIDCSMFHTTTPKSIQATVVSVVIPFCILLFTLPFWILWWQGCIRRKTNAVGLGAYLGSRMRITAIALAFYFYPQLVNNILSIFSCKQLDVQNSHEDTPHELLTAVGKWWTSDYNLQCYKGQHLVLMLALGIPGILIICVGIPVWSALLLRANKKYHKEMHFAATYALMYADYRDRFYYWESLVMLRKFVLVLLAVSINANTPVLKLLACLAWIEASTIVVVAAKPFRLPRMDRLERVSHWGNAFTIILLALFFIEPSNVGLKVFCTVSLILGNAAVIVYMVIQIFREALYSLMVDLDAEARGTLKFSDLQRDGSTDSMTRLKIGAVTALLAVICRLPSWLEQWLLIYPCQHIQTKSLQGQGVPVLKQSSADVDAFRQSAAAVVADDMTVARVHVSSIQMPVITPASDFSAPGLLTRQATDWRQASQDASCYPTAASWQRHPFL